MRQQKKNLTPLEKRAARDRLHDDLAKARAQEATAERQSSPLEAAFWDAHRQLDAMPLQPETSKAERLAAYDARMHAGHAWHPSRSRLRDARRWIKAIMEEIEHYE